MAFLTRSWSAVNGVAGLPGANPIAAIRSEDDSRSMNALAAIMTLRAAPKRMFGSSTASTISRPPVVLSFELYPSGSGATAPDVFFSVTSDTHSALTTRRALPSTFTLKSAGARSRIGLP